MDPKTVQPRPASFKGMDGNLRKAGQLAEPVISLGEGLKQGPSTDESVPPFAQTAGVGPWEANRSGTHMKERGAIDSV